MSLLKPEASTVAGVATAALAVGIFQTRLPSLAECRTSDCGDMDLDSAEKSAAWTSAAIVAGVSLLAKDPTIFIVGSVTILALSWTHKHANEVDPVTGRLPIYGTGTWGGHDSDGD